MLIVVPLDQMCAQNAQFKVTPEKNNARRVEHFIPNLLQNSHLEKQFTCHNNVAPPQAQSRKTNKSFGVKFGTQKARIIGPTVGGWEDTKEDGL